MCHECFAIYEINDDLKTQLKRLKAQLTTITEERDIFARTLDKRDKELTAAQEELRRVLMISHQGQGLYGYALDLRRREARLDELEKKAEALDRLEEMKCATHYNVFADKWSVRGPSDGWCTNLLDAINEATRK